MADGYGFWWKDGYWASLTTGGNPTAGRHDIFFGPVPADTHGHVWIKIPDVGTPTLGSALKDRGQRAGTTIEGQFSTGAVLRGRVQVSPDGNALVTEIAQVAPPSTYSAAPVTSHRRASSREPQRVDITVPQEASWFDFELGVTMRRSSDASTASSLLPFAEPSPLAVRLTVTSWGR